MRISKELIKINTNQISTNNNINNSKVINEKRNYSNYFGKVLDTNLEGLGYLFIILKYNRTLNNKNNDILIAGYDYNLAEQILWNKFSSPLYLRRDDLGFVKNFIVDYLNKYEDITGLDSSLINNNILILNLELLDSSAHDLYYHQYSGNILNEFTPKLVSLGILDPYFKGWMSYLGRLMTVNSNFSKGLGINSVKHSDLTQERVVPFNVFLSNNSCKDYLTNIIRTTTNRDLTYKPSQINNINFAEYV